MFNTDDSDTNIAASVTASRARSRESASGEVFRHPVRTSPVILASGFAVCLLLTSGNLTAQPQISAGSYHNCVLTPANKVRCWGTGYGGRLGYANTEDIGDDVVPATAGDVNVGADVAQVSAGQAHTCVVTTGNTVRCWGWGGRGQLGYANTEDIGDDEDPASAGDVNVGLPVSQVSSGFYHTCVVTTGNTVRCWGHGEYGKLGYASTDALGDDEDPSLAGDVNVGAAVVQVSAGQAHTCVVTTSNTVRCWGWGRTGRLGYGNDEAIGDDETPGDSGDVNVGVDVVHVTTGARHTCVLTAENKVRCWGTANNGQLGYGNKEHIGDNEDPASVGDVSVGADVLQVSAGDFHTCVVTTGNTVRCWGHGTLGRLGYGNEDQITNAASAGDVNVGADVVQVSAGHYHTCVVTTGNTVRCWGGGALGYGNSERIGDDEDPATAGDVIVFDGQLPVELASFDVLVEGHRAKLIWSTASESENAGFEVHHLFERSGQTFWDVVGFVKGAGSTTSPMGYSFEVDDLEPGRHRFRLKQIDFDGTFEFSPEIETVVEVPGSHFLSDAYPNPFNPRSYFGVAVPTEQVVSATLHDAMGRHVRTLFEGGLPANEQHWITIEGAGLASGVYLYRVEGENFTESRTVTLQK